MVELSMMPDALVHKLAFIAAFWSLFETILKFTWETQIELSKLALQVSRYQLWQHC